MPHLELNPNDFPIKFEIRIDWSEVDSFGHINNLAIMRYVQSARVHALESIGMMQHHASTGVGPILATTSCQFRKQLYYPGVVTILAKIDHIKTTSFQMNHIVLNEALEVVAEAHDVLVVFDFNKDTKCPIPESFREKFFSLGASNAI
jgi:acyl-CoA thioester hydrolase